MNMAEQLDAIRDILASDDLCAEAMVSEIAGIVFEDDDEDGEDAGGEA